MARLGLQSAAASTTSDYAKQLARHLRLPAEEASEIVAETEAHVEDRVDDLVIAGSSRLEANPQAIADFGSARVYARRLTDSFFSSAGATRAGRAGRLLICLMFSLFVAMEAFGGPFVNAIFNTRWLGETLVFASISLVPVLIVAFAYFARRAQTKLIVVFGLALTLVTIASGGYYLTRLPDQQLADRREAPAPAKFWRTERDAVVRKQIRDLDAGIAAYRDKAGLNTIPSDLRQGSSFVVPVSVQGEIANAIHMREFPLGEPLFTRYATPGGG